MKLKIELESEQDVDNISIKVKYVDGTTDTEVISDAPKRTRKKAKEGEDEAFTQSW